MIQYFIHMHILNIIGKPEVKKKKMSEENKKQYFLFLSMTVDEQNKIKNKYNDMYICNNILMHVMLFMANIILNDQNNHIVLYTL